jgi:hypothetical protein
MLDTNVVNGVAAFSEVRQALEDDLISNGQWLAPWAAGLDAGIRASFGR